MCAETSRAFVEAIHPSSERCRASVGSAAIGLEMTATGGRLARPGLRFRCGRQGPPGTSRCDRFRRRRRRCDLRGEGRAVTAGAARGDGRGLGAASGGRPPRTGTIPIASQRRATVPASATARPP